MITIKNLIVALQNQEILKSISCNLLSGRITAFIGKSGAGKTTLLKTMVGLIAKNSGSVLIDDKELSRLSSQQKSECIGFVFQDFNLFPHLTVLQNCCDPLHVHGYTDKQAQEVTYKILTNLEMESFAHKYPHALSGGQRQRVAIARALCLNPKVLLLDEPTASLDPHTTDVLVNLLQKLAQQGLTIGVSSQDMSFVRKIFDRVYFMQAGTIVEFCDDRQKLSQESHIGRFIKE